MGIVLRSEPQVTNPVLLAAWPGIGNIGLIAIDTLRVALQAEEFGDIEPWEFFYPKRLLIRSGILEHLEFPSNKFYWARTGARDLLFFIGEEQPANRGRMYAEGRQAYRMANLVLDVAARFGCRRVYTSGAAVALTHHTIKPRVWAVPNHARLIQEVKEHENTVLMSDIEEGSGQGNITGLNGLLLGVAGKRGVEGVCMMGEIPTYLQGVPLPYPKASKSVIEALTRTLGIEVNLAALDDMIQSIEARIEEFYQQIPPDMKDMLERLKNVAYSRPSEPGPITEDDKKKIMEDIDQLFKQQGGHD